MLTNWSRCFHTPELNDSPRSYGYQTQNCSSYRICPMTTLCSSGQGTTSDLSFYLKCCVGDAVLLLRWCIIFAFQCGQVRPLWRVVENDPRSQELTWSWIGFPIPEGSQDNSHDGDDDDDDETRVERWCLPIGGQGSLVSQTSSALNCTQSKIWDLFFRSPTDEPLQLLCGVSILVCHPHLTIIICCTAVWAQACGSEHKTSFVIIVHHWFNWCPWLSLDPCWCVGGSSITILPLLVQIIRTSATLADLCSVCAGKHVTVSRYCRFCTRFWDGGSTSFSPFRPTSFSPLSDGNVDFATFIQGQGKAWYENKTQSLSFLSQRLSAHMLDFPSPTPQISSLAICTAGLPPNSRLSCSGSGLPATRFLPLLWFSYLLHLLRPDFFRCLAGGVLCSAGLFASLDPDTVALHHLFHLFFTSRELILELFGQRHQLAFPLFVFPHALVPSLSHVPDQQKQVLKLAWDIFPFVLFGLSSLFPSELAELWEKDRKQAVTCPHSLPSVFLLGSYDVCQQRTFHRATLQLPTIQLPFVRRYLRTRALPRQHYIPRPRGRAADPVANLSVAKKCDCWRRGGNGRHRRNWVGSVREQQPSRPSSAFNSVIGFSVPTFENPWVL